MERGSRTNMNDATAKKQSTETVSVCVEEKKEVLKDMALFDKKKKG